MAAALETGLALSLLAVELLDGLMHQLHHLELLECELGQRPASIAHSVVAWNRLSIAIETARTFAAQRVGLEIIRERRDHLDLSPHLTGTTAKFFMIS